MATRMTLVMLLTCATAGLLVAETTIKNEVKITPADAQAQSGRVLKGDTEAFESGEMFYNAIPSTPAVGTAVRVVDSDDDKDYITRSYQISTPDIVYELRNYMQKPLNLEGGKVETSLNADTGQQYLIITAPAFQFPGLERLIRDLDKQGVTHAKSGSARLIYDCKNRRASELYRILDETLVSGYGDLVIDDRINKIMIKDSPSERDRCAKYLPYWDVPPEMVRIEVEIVEIEMGDDFNFGLALEAWKEALPEEVNMSFDWAQDSAGGSLTPDTWAKFAAQSLDLNGMRPKAAAHIINYLVRKGKAKVLSRPTVVAVNGEETTVQSTDKFSYKTYQDPDSPMMNRQASAGIEVTIIPTIGTESLTLEIEAEVSSLVGWSTGNEPIINSRNTAATVVLKDGQLFTLSGLRKDTINKMDERVPILGSIPLVGYAFRHEIDVKQTSEILVMLRPTKVSADDGVLERERRILQETEDAADAPPKSEMDKFIDRVVFNKF